MPEGEIYISVWRYKKDGKLQTFEYPLVHTLEGAIANYKDAAHSSFDYQHTLKIKGGRVEEIDIEKILDDQAAEAERELKEVARVELGFHGYQQWTKERYHEEL